jgi:hypothetical protein
MSRVYEDLKLVQEQKEEEVREIIERLIDLWDIDYLLTELKKFENQL